MTNEELIEYIKESIADCDRLKAKWRTKPNHDNVSKIFEGMAEAYCDIYAKLTGGDYDNPERECCGNCANTSSNAYTELTGDVWCSIGNNPHRKTQMDICSQYKRKDIQDADTDR